MRYIYAELIRVLEQKRFYMINFFLYDKFLGDCCHDFAV